MVDVVAVVVDVLAGVVVVGVTWCVSCCVVVMLYTRLSWLE